MEDVILPVAIRDAIVEHAVGCLPFEACGLLAARPATRAAASTGVIAARFYPVVNEARSATTFRLDGQGHLDAEVAAEAAGLMIVGVVHSHPSTPAALSETDLAAAAAYDPEGRYVQIVVSLAGWSSSAATPPVIRGFRIVAGAVQNLEVRG